MNFEQWVQRWQIPEQCLEELKQVAVPANTEHDMNSHSERAVQAKIDVAAAQREIMLYRNNSGAMRNEYGNMIRFGLGNTSAQINAVFKSGDLIGWTPVVVGPQHMGRVFAVFTSVEVKSGDWQYKGTNHEQAQLKWANTVNAHGGIGIFATHPDHVFTAIKDFRNG